MWESMREMTIHYKCRYFVMSLNSYLLRKVIFSLLAWRKNFIYKLFYLRDDSSNMEHEISTRSSQYI